MAEDVEDLLQVVVMRFEVGAIYKNVVKVYYDAVVQKTPEDIVDKSLKYGRSIG